MKKTYIMPLAEVLDVNASDIIAASMEVGFSEEGYDGVAGTIEDFSLDIWDTDTNSGN